LNYYHIIQFQKAPQRSNYGAIAQDDGKNTFFLFLFYFSRKIGIDCTNIDTMAFGGVDSSTSECCDCPNGQQIFGNVPCFCSQYR